MTSHRPNAQALADWKARMEMMGINNPSLELIQSQVVDHAGTQALVFAPVKMRRSTKHASEEAIEWLRYMEKDIVKLPIWHEENGHEVEIIVADRSYHVDGYCPYNMTVYEYLGEAYHPFPLVVDLAKEFSDQSGKTHSSGRSYDHEMCKYHTLGLLGFRVVSIWAKQWHSIRKKVTPRTTTSQVPVQIASTSTLSSIVTRATAYFTSRQSDKPVIIRAMCSNTKLNTNTTASRRQVMLASSVQSLDELLEAGAADIYGVPKPSPEKMVHLSIAENIIRFIALQATTRSLNISASIHGMMVSSSDDEILPFSVHKLKKQMTRSSFAQIVSIGANFLEILSPGVLHKKFWQFTPISKNNNEVIALALMNYATANRAQLIQIFGKKQDQFTEAPWSSRKAIAFTNPILERLFGFKYSRLPTDDYIVVTNPMFAWNGTNYAPV